jgi:hypothetical protein
VEGGVQRASDLRLRIFINHRKFEERDGVRDLMTGAEIVALVGVHVDMPS